MTTTRPAYSNYLFWVAAIALLFVQLGNTGMWQSEDRWLEVAREMLLSGNYFRPTVNGVLYFDKPLLSYWFVVACSFVTGLNEWALRVPSALAALAALWATRDLARQLWNTQTAYYAGWVLLTSMGLLQWGRLGEADMQNLAATILAVSWYWRQRGRTTFTGYAVFYLILSLGAQCKGLTAMIVPGLAVLADMIINRSWRQHVNTRHAAAIALGACVYLLPFLLAPRAVHDTHDGLWLVMRENIVRYVAPFDHTGPIYTYLIAIPRQLALWSIVFVFALAAGIRHRWHHTAQATWLLVTAALIFVFFTASGSRRHYYILPILPYCALMIAAYLREAHTQLALRITATLLILASLAQITLLFLFERINQRSGGSLPADLQAASVVIGTLALAAMAIAYVVERDHSNRLFASCVAAAAVLLGGYFLKQQVLIDGMRTEAPFARQLSPIISAHPNLQIAILNDRPPAKLLFYADMPPSVKIIRSTGELEQFIAATAVPKLILAYRKDDAMLPPQLSELAPVVAEERHPWENEKKNKDKARAWLLP
jgi:4-amino-4-deoxy-L-arabinose transferase-like glycosyltransferase